MSARLVLVLVMAHMSTVLSLGFLHVVIVLVKLMRYLDAVAVADVDHDRHRMQFTPFYLLFTNIVFYLLRFVTHTVCPAHLES